jgi:hypothetical protein
VTASSHDHTITGTGVRDQDMLLVLRWLDYSAGSDGIDRMSQICRFLDGDISEDSSKAVGRFYSIELVWKGLCVFPAAQIRMP